MPNYAYNTVQLFGPRSQKQALLERVHTNDLKEGENEFDFNTIIPMPESIRNTVSGTTSSISEAVYAYLQNPSDIRPIESYLNGQTPAEFIAYATEKKLYDAALAERIAYNRERYDGCATWYDWSCRFWGTKWNSMEASVEDDTITFDTAWSPACPIVCALSQQFPTLRFLFTYEVEGCDGIGIEVYQAGECIYEVEHEHQSTFDRERETLENDYSLLNTSD